jgi:hypothetical protein
VHTRRELIEKIEEQLRQAKELEYVTYLEFHTNRVIVYFSPHVLYKTIHELVKHINTTYKDVAFIPCSLYLTNPTKRITIHYKQDNS